MWIIRATPPNYIKCVNLYFADHFLPQNIDRLWIGLSQFDKQETCVWDSGQNVTFASYLQFPISEDCVCLRYGQIGRMSTGWIWHSYTCYIEISFICEMPSTN